MNVPRGFKIGQKCHKCGNPIVLGREAPEPKPDMGRPIKPIGLRIIDHPKLAEWTAKGQASQEADGLWLHYAAICTLLKEAEGAVKPDRDHATKWIKQSVEMSGWDVGRTLQKIEPVAFVDELAAVLEAYLQAYLNRAPVAVKPDRDAEIYEKCARIADQWAISANCSSHDDNPCCHVRTGQGIADAIRQEAIKLNRAPDQQERAIAAEQEHQS